MEVKANTKYIRMSPKKVRVVADLIRGLDALEAINQLRFISRRAVRPILKTLNSAIANAEHNFNLKKENLFIKKIIVNEGPVLKRQRPRAFGRVSPIRKKSSHIEIVLDELKATEVAKRKEKISKPLSRETVTEKELPSEVIKESVVQPVAGHKPKIFDFRRRGKDRAKQHLDKLGLKKAGGVVKRVFRRKAI